MAAVVEKEAIPQLNIIPAFVDKSEHWQNTLLYATRLGNEFKGKTRITFETTQGPKIVETTVWSVAGGFLQLKAGMFLPLNSIIDVQFF